MARLEYVGILEGMDERGVFELTDEKVISCWVKVLQRSVQL